MKKEHELAYVGTFLGDNHAIKIPEELIQKRRKICAYCPHRVPHVKQVQNFNIPTSEDGKELPKTAEIIWNVEETEICELCGCEIGDKVEQISGWCPLYKWELSYEEWAEYILPELENRISTEGSYEPMEWERESQRKNALKREMEQQQLDSEDSGMVE